MRHRFLVCGAAALSLGATYGILVESAQGAVRKCLPSVRGEGADPVSEIEARRKAIDGWLEAASIHGREFTRFALSAERSIDCRRIETGGFACSILAMPCSVLQNPNLLPPEAYDRSKRALDR